MIRLKKIADIVSDYIEADIRMKGRKRECVNGRAIYYKLAQEYTHHSLERIGEVVNRDHASVYVALKGFKTFEFYKDNYWKAYIEIRKQLDDDIGVSEYKDNPDLFWKKEYFKLKKKISRLQDA